MRNSKLIQVICSLEEKEFKELGRFMKSPYLNTQKKLINLYDSISKFQPGFTSKQMNKEIIWKRIYPGKEFNLKKMTDLMSEMNLVIKKFIGLNLLNKNTIANDYLALLAFKEKRLLKLFKEQTQKIANNLNKIEVKSTDDFLWLFLLEKEYYYNSLTSKAPPAGDLLITSHDYLEKYYLLQKLKLTLESNLRARIFLEKKLLPIEGLDHKLIAVNLEEPLINIYYSLIQIQGKNDSELSRQLQDKVNQYLPYLSKEDKIIIIHALINHISQLYHSGQPKLVFDLLKLFQLGLDEELFLTHDKNIRHTTFLNISITAATAKDFKFFDSFISDYNKLLSEAVRNDTVNLSNAYSFFHKGDYNLSMHHLLRLGHSTLPEFKFRQRNLEIRCVYEIAQKDRTFLNSLSSKITAFEKYLTRDEVLAETRTKGYLNFIRITKKLIPYLEEKKLEKNKKDALIDELKSYKKIVSFNWLEEKILRKSKDSGKNSMSSPQNN